ncbi:precorrin-6y C5,15-methyltransferase (decarboxylating) subunit CbiE [Thermopolyspora sp. NPDC052614]|uniref:precorrin-6y C5,15-methyltransferase (decarboxylating) subunit CbiE n=1 Tax=Thermopolyspora sp. NPDC052614 TaxID=3155682 RepID=UPI00344ABACC
MITVVGLDGTPLPPHARARLADADLVIGAPGHLSAVPAPETARRVTVQEGVDVLDLIEEALADLLRSADTGATATSAAGPLGGPTGGPTGGLPARLAETFPSDTVRIELGRTARGAESGPANVVVLATGDPGFFGIVRALRERGHSPEVLPAVSVVARAFAKAGINWEDAIVVSARGRDFRRAVNVCRAHRKVAVLTGPGAGPSELARALAPSTPRSLVVCEDLGGPDERVSWPRLGEATTRPWRNPDVVLVLDRGRQVGGGPGWIAGAAPGPEEWALPADAFATGGRRRVTAEARALVLARLGPRLGDLVWDVGAGDGEVAVECARLGAAVVAVERDAAACERIRRNVVAHRVKVMLSCGVARRRWSRSPTRTRSSWAAAGPR